MSAGTASRLAAAQLEASELLELLDLLDTAHEDRVALGPEGTTGAYEERSRAAARVGALCNALKRGLLDLRESLGQLEGDVITAVA